MDRLNRVDILPRRLEGWMGNRIKRKNSRTQKALVNDQGFLFYNWWSQRDSNPCYRRESSVNMPHSATELFEDTEPSGRTSGHFA